MKQDNEINKNQFINQYVKDEIKNSSNPEIDFKEFDSEIKNLIKIDKTIYSNSSTSKIVENEHSPENSNLFLNIGTWQNNETQDKKQFENAYSKIKNFKNMKSKIQEKKKEVILIKNEKLTQILASKKMESNVNMQQRGFGGLKNEDYDLCNEEIDEFNMLNNKGTISSINMKDNNINNIHKKNLSKPSYKKEICLTEHGNYIDPVINNKIHGGHSRNLSYTNMGPINPNHINKMYNNVLTPNNNKINANVIPFGNYTPAPRNINFGQNNFNRINSNIMFGPNNINPSNICNMMMYKNSKAKNNLVSQSNYSSSNKLSGMGIGAENEDSTEIGDYSHEDGPNSHRTTNSNNTYHYSFYNNNLSGNKLRLNTQESSESGNSASQSQIGFCKNQIYSNLFPHINNKTPTSACNTLYSNEEIFSTSVNNERYNMTPKNLDKNFSIYPKSNINKINSSINNLNYKNNLSLHTINEDSIHDLNYRIVLDDILYGKEIRTTVMIRNIPIRYNDEMLFKELEEFEGKFDCLFLPYDYTQGGNKGYGFINFIHPYHILLFYDKLEGKPWNLFESKKICELKFAKFQGIAEIKKHSDRYKEKKPVFFKTFELNEKIEIPKQYVNKLRQKSPNIQWENGQFGGIKLIL